MFNFSDIAWTHKTLPSDDVYSNTALEKKNSFVSQHNSSTPYWMKKPAHYGKTWTWNVIGELIDTIHYAYKTCLHATTLFYICINAACAMK